MVITGHPLHLDPVHSVVAFEPLAGLDAAVPIVMLPVRVETRWFPVDDATRIELRIRVFPDEVHVAAPLAATGSERESAAAYFAARTADGPDAPSTRQCFAQLVDSTGASRAAWLVRALAPGMPAVPDADTDTRTPTVAAMPQRWIAIAKAPGLRTTATGLPIAANLPAAPHGNDASTPDAYLGKTLSWVTDFVAAEQAGMALRMTMLRADAARLDELLVVGVPTSDADASAAVLGDLLARHAGGTGAELLPPGTPTNSVGRATDPGRTAIGASPTGDAQRTLAALGVDAAIACDVVADAVDRGGVARAMNLALWPATWGAFLVDQAGQSAGTVAAARALYLNHVRPTGPYPTLCAGAQPYGLLPATSLARWPVTSPRGALAALLVKVAADWQPAAASVPRLVDSTDLDRDLLAVLRRAPASTTAWIRQVFDSQTATLLLNNGPRVYALLHHLNVQITTALGVPAAMPIFDRVVGDHVRRLGIPFVAPGSAPRDRPLAVNYLTAIANAATPADLAAGTGAPSPKTLLYLLARYASVHARSAPSHDLSTATTGAMTELAHTTTFAVAEHAAATTVAETGAATSVSVGGHGPVVLPSSAAREHAATLRALGAVSVGELESAFHAVLDSAAFRVDAWTTALAKERLEALRAPRPRASYVSGWAWVERPRPRTRAAPGGYLHAPSLAQVRTAAVLRAGYEAHRLDDAGSTLAIDLSSERVRGARWLLAGMRDGRPIARLLGDHLERWLLARDPNTDLLALRRSSVAAGQPVPDLADGWALYHAWTAQQATSTLPAARAPALAELVALIDAVADLLLAETVHNAIAGASSARAGAALDALQRGEVATPDPRVDRTSTDGVSVRRRVALALHDAPGWPGPARPRATAAPRLEGFAAQILGAPAGASITITDRLPSATTGTTVTRTLADLDLCALDVVALAGGGSDRALLDRAAATVPTIDGATRTVVASPALDAVILRAAALSRLSRTARPLDPGEVGEAAGGNPLVALAALPVVASAPGELAAWLSDVARARPALEPLDLLVLVAPDALPTSRRTLPDGTDLAIVGALAGVAEVLVIDAWSESAPAATISTGVAFPYDAPRAQPPQAILLAVPPPTIAWSLSLVEAIIDETIAAARLRMCDSERVRNQLVPAIVVPDDPHDFENTLDLHSVVAVAAVTNLEVLR
jgi:hypothetical protein